jgi:hypothetical protein
MRQQTAAGALIAGLALALPACQSAKKVDQPLFTGAPIIADLSAAKGGTPALAAPNPAFKRLKFSIRAAASGKTIGEATETLKAAAEGYGQFLEETTYRLMSGKCTVLNRSEAVAVGGFLTLLHTGEIWSPDCADLAGGRDRRQVTEAAVRSGHLFPLAAGNKLSLRYRLVGSDSERETGRASYEETWDEAYEVVERIADYRLEDGRSLGEVFMIRVTAAGSTGKQRSYTFAFSTRLGWRVAYATDIRYSLIDWLQ